MPLLPIDLFRRPIFAVSVTTSVLCFIAQGLDLQHSRELGDDLQSRIARAHPSPPERLRFMTDVSPLGQSNEILLISRIELEVAVAVDGLDLDLALLGVASHSQLDCDTSLATTP